ncbi:MAG: exo-alpha-sialidase [Acidobacteria bacterium]|nr:exo-alpha-sialidase [Acidobacteriota bacterium]
MRILRMAAAVSAIAAGLTAEPVHHSEAIFPLSAKHNHASTIVELPNGDLLVCWYRGSGERTADDVQILGARKKKGAAKWSDPFVLADTPGFPDTNPTMFVDSKQRLWLLWQIIVANEWHTALTMIRTTTQWKGDGAPKWETGDPLMLVPRNFAAKFHSTLDPLVNAEGRTGEWAKRLIQRGDDKYFSRMGWMTRVHPIELATGRIIVPLYSDGYSISLMGITDDGGKTWTTSEPLIGAGNIQPTLARRKDGTIVAYMRDNGPPPKRLHVSESKDDGITWSTVKDSEIPNPGTGSEVMVLKDGNWLLINNDIERGRYSLALWMSDDEGRTWKWKKSLERDNRGEGAGSFHYPSIIQTRDGMIHSSYSYFLNHLPKGSESRRIQHTWFNEEWIKQP